MTGATRPTKVFIFRVLAAFWILSVAVCVVDAATYAIGRIIPELSLKDGKILRSVTVMSVGETSVMAKWEGGRGSVRMTLLPDDVRADFAKLAPPPAPDTRDEYQKANDDREAILKNPIPVRPTIEPQAVHGDIGPSDGVDKVIRGQIFIVSNDGVNHPLGNVKVRVFGLAAFNELSPKIRAEIKPTLDYYLAMGKRAVAKFNAEEGQYYVNLSNALLDSEFSLLPTSPYATTDADGRFELHHTLREPVAIVARASRSVGEKSEHYLWAVGSTAFEHGGKIILSNSNAQ